MRVTDEQPAQDPGWTIVHAPVPLDQVEEVQCRFSDGWAQSAVMNGDEWSSSRLAAGDYRVRYKPGCPKPEGAAQPFPPIGTAQVKAPVQDAFADPRISALEAENAALRWALENNVVQYASYNDGSHAFRSSDGVIHVVDGTNRQHFLAARAAMERKP